VYKQLYRLLKPLAHRLLSIPLNSGEGSTPPATVMDVLRELCATAYIDCIVKGCLVPSVPTNQSDLDNYKDVVMETKKIEVCWHSYNDSLFDFERKICPVKAVLLGVILLYILK